MKKVKLNESLKWRLIYHLSDQYCVKDQNPHKVDICQLVRRLMFACFIGVPFAIILLTFVSGIFSFPLINLISLFFLGEGIFTPYVSPGMPNAIGGLLFIGSITYFVIAGIAIVVGIGKFLTWAKRKIVMGFRKIPTVPEKEKEPSLIAEWYRGIKEKTCFYIQFDHN